MVVVHIIIIRGMNSIYLQAPHVQPADYADFVGVCELRLEWGAAGFVLRWGGVGLSTDVRVGVYAHRLIALYWQICVSCED